MYSLVSFVVTRQVQDYTSAKGGRREQKKELEGERRGGRGGGECFIHSI